MPPAFAVAPWSVEESWIDEPATISGAERTVVIDVSFGAIARCSSHGLVAGLLFPSPE